MQTVNQIAALRQQIKNWKRAGLTVGFVPTMGNLHQGHLTLVRRARELADKVVVSIFVNPMQFDRADDLARYPRTLQQDAALLEQQQADLLFTPTPEIIYPQGLEQHTFVDVPGISQVLEGANRPGHFRGVSTVVSTLFNLVQPDIACFGEKDFQQLALIRKMVRDLAFDIEIIGVPTVRAEDGLALSSRNGYLTAEQRQIAPLLYKKMQQMAQEIDSGERKFDKLVTQVTTQLNAAGFNTDSIDVCDALTLREVTRDTREVVVLAAAFLGKARLIDNLVIPLQD